MKIVWLLETIGKTHLEVEFLKKILLFTQCFSCKKMCSEKNKIIKTFLKTNAILKNAQKHKK